MSIPRDIPPGHFPGPQFWFTRVPFRLRTSVMLLRFIWGMEHIR